MVLLEDSIVILSVIITALFVIMSFFLLSRYRKLVSLSSESSMLAKNLWDALEMRLKKQDERIVDLMAQVELYGARSAREIEVRRGEVERKEVRREMRFEARPSPPPVVTPSIPMIPQAAHPPIHAGATETEVLRLLNAGPKSSTEITRMIGKSREHTARMMKTLFEDGFVVRDESKRPFVYRLTEHGKSYLETASG